jgi:mannose-6-phosphate isomerase-like protein (cupin superfamily)
MINLRVAPRLYPRRARSGPIDRERILFMRHAADVAHGHQTHIGHEERMEKAVAHIPPGLGARSLWVLRELVTYKVPSRRTGGAYALFEATAQPGTGPPPHVHHREDEAFYVLEGEYEFLLGGDALRAGAGSLLYVPKGTLHAHKNVGEGVGRMLVTQTPGGLYELFFQKAGMPVDGDDGASPAFKERSEAGKRIVEAAAEHGMEIPLPTAQDSRSRIPSKQASNEAEKPHPDATTNGR